MAIAIQSPAQNVGIGTPSPTNTLHVQSTTVNETVKIDNLGNGGTLICANNSENPTAYFSNKYSLATGIALKSEAPFGGYAGIFNVNDEGVAGKFLATGTANGIEVNTTESMGIGVQVFAKEARGIYTHSNSEDGLWGSSISKRGVFGISVSGIGVMGSSESGTGGNFLSGNIGINAEGLTGIKTKGEYGYAGIQIDGAIAVTGANKAAFKVTSNASNTTSNYITLPIFDDVNAIYIVTLDGTTTLLDKTYAVKHNGAGKWQIYLTDGSPMPLNVTFNVLNIKQF